MPELTWPTVTVIVPVFNEEHVLPHNLESLLALDYPSDRLDIVYVDNNSSDGSKEILEQATGKVTVIEESTPGAGAARNRGIRHCQSELVAFTDADCRVDPGWLKALVAPLVSDPQNLASGGRILSQSRDNYISLFGESIHDHKNAIEHCEPPYLVTMNMAVSRENLLRVGLFDEDLLRGQDCDLAFRLGLQGLKFQYVDEAIIWHWNQETLAGLFREGYTHGRWSVPLIEKHRESLFSYRPRSPVKSAPRILPLLKSFVGRSLRGRKLARHELCLLYFNSGKKFGVISGARDLARDTRKNSGLEKAEPR